MPKRKGVIVHAMAERLRDPRGDGQDMAASDYLRWVGLSAHYLIHPNGRLEIMRHHDRLAYHARGFNADHVGIEVLVPGAHNYGSFLTAIKRPWCTAAAWDMTVSTCVFLCETYDLTPESLRGHSEVSPRRKRDPGAGFDMDKLRAEIRLRL